MARIYVSSTSEDLKQCRAAVLSALRRMRHDVVAMEDYTAMNGSPLAECLQDVASCEVYIELFAWRYGYIPDDDDNNPDQKSITELEFLKADSIGIPCYIFILDENASWPVIHVDQESNNIRSLRDYFCNRKIVDFFTDENTLATQVSTTIAKRESSLVKASITIEEHKTRLEAREQELREELSSEQNQDRSAEISLELNATQKQLTNLELSYQESIKRNEDLARSLEELQTQHPGARLEAALDSVKSGDNSIAKQLFRDVVEKGEELNVTFGEAAYQMGNIAKGEIRYQEAFEYLQKAVNFRSENTTYLNSLGQILDTLGQYEKAIEYYEQALASELKTFGENNLNVAIVRNNLGLAWDSLGQYEKAIEYYEQALASGLKTLGEDHPKVATRRNNLGLAWKSLGQYKKAIEYYEQALVSDLKTYGEDHPQVAIYRNNLGGAWRSLGQTKKAIEYYEQALASDLKTYGEDHPDVALDRNNLGLAWKSLGQYKKAIEYYELALAVFEKVLGIDHPSTKTVVSNLAEAMK